MRQWIPFVVVLTISSVLQAQDAPDKPWTSSLGAGLALTSGNRDTRNFNLSFNTLWDPQNSRIFKADAVYLLGESEGERQVDKATANGRFERLFDDRAFWFTEVQYLRDPFKEISHLISPLAGAGYHLVRTDNRKVTLDGAVGGVFEDNAAYGRETSGAVKAGESFEWQLSEASRVTQRASGLWKVNDFSDAHYHFDAGLTTAVVAALELKISYVFDYKNRTPSPEIQKGDSALFAAFLYRF